MRHRDKTALQKISSVIDEITEILKNVSKEEFLINNTLKLATGMSIIRIGELVETLTMEFRDNQKQIAWKDIAGFRDIAAHKYDIIDMEEMYDTIKNELPELKFQIEKILADDSA
ncbi:MAG: DUF86 domain-containing protein [Selenomonadaceae bacterium]|nr:DUF86 domain-containing protein [Selenomonadaceae bacterium]MBQ7629620.1 DUF86 domain-containing protein [Selenomonadaceae bacterium]